jgi:4-hydroxythreonine-4-phosphate dehydrogenase
MDQVGKSRPMTLPRIGITLGDVNGIGPELVVKLFAHHDPARACDPVVIGDVNALRAVQHLAPGCPPIIAIPSLTAPLPPNAIPVFDGGCAAPSVRFGVLDPAAGHSAVVWIEGAARACIDGTLAAMVTCPISKDCIYQAGHHYIGHTELVAELTNTPDYRMCLFAGDMRIVHITGHLSLREALDWVKKDRIVTSVEIGHDALRKLGIENPRIGVAGLNPHAGEAGAFGREEIEEIRPAVETCIARGLACSGPYPPDTIFRTMQEGHLDMVIAMYHDQGHIPLKLIAMDEGVNVTLGVPIVRTSVDHGTAFDIAGKGLARESSLVAALNLAVTLGRRA